MNTEYDSPVAPEPEGFTAENPPQPGQRVQVTAGWFKGYFRSVSRFQPCLFPGFTAVWLGPHEERRTDQPNVIPDAELRPVHHTFHHQKKQPGFLIDDDLRPRYHPQTTVENAPRT